MKRGANTDKSGEKSKKSGGKSAKLRSRIKKEPRKVCKMCNSND